MTHPDILKMEAFGELNPSTMPQMVGKCTYCEQALYDDMPELTRSTDGVFCDLCCCHEFYEITRA